MPSKKRKKSRKKALKRTRVKIKVSKSPQVFHIERKSRQRFQGFVIVQLLILLLLLSFLFQEEPLQEIREEKEITDQDLKEEIQDLVNEVYAKNRGLLEGIHTISVTRQDLDFLDKGGEPVCEPGDILGAFGQDKIIIKDSGKEVNRKTFYHEVGHNVWGKLTGEQKEEWEQLHEENVYVSVYASVNAYEDFAESFSCYSTQFEDCIGKLSEGKKSFLEKVVS